MSILTTLRHPLTRSVALLFVLGAFAAAPTARALPALQLWSEDGEWDNATKAWVINEPAGTFTITGLALDKHLGSGKGNAFRTADTTAFLTFALVSDAGFTGTELIGDFGDIFVNNSVVSTNWAYGRPPIDSNDNLPDHGVYPTWFVEYEFDFGGFGDDIFSAKGGNNAYLSVKDVGFREDFAVEVSGFSMNPDENVRVHIDLYTKDNHAGVYRFSPDNRDVDVYLARQVSVPGPGSLALFVIAAAGFGVSRWFASRQLQAEFLTQDARPS